VEFGNDPVVKSMFLASVDVQLGDGNLTLFWSDRWNDGNSPYLIAPELCNLIRPMIKNTRTVHDALDDKRWIQDITGTFTVAAISEYLSFWQVLEAVQLQPGVKNNLKWKWTPDATYSAKSAYLMLFQGSERFEGAKQIWKAWAPLKVKFFTWLAV
jgi:hypothetical protein